MVRDLQDLQDPAERDFVVSLLSLQDQSLRPVLCALSPYFLSKPTSSASSLLNALSTSRALNGNGPFDSSGILYDFRAVSYTHLTLPTIYSV